MFFCGHSNEMTGEHYLCAYISPIYSHGGMYVCLYVKIAKIAKRTDCEGKQFAYIYSIADLH